MSEDSKTAQNEELLLLNHSSAILSISGAEAFLGQFSAIFMERLSKVTLKDINPLVISALANNFCAKVFLWNSETPIDKDTFAVLEFLFGNNLIPTTFLSAMKQRAQLYRQVNLLPQPSPSSQPQTGTVGPQAQVLAGQQNPPPKPLFQPQSSTPSEHVQQILSQLLATSTGEKVNKNYGYSLLSLNGDFIWCDSVSQKLFEFKEKKNINKNLFDQMIPFSKQLLAKKFGPNLFQENCDFGTSIVFSYVTYSKNSMNKFYKCIRSLVKSEEEFRERLKKKETDEAIYNQYLKALSSRATFVLMKFTRGEMQSMISNRSMGIKTKCQFFEGLNIKNADKRSRKEFNESTEGQDVPPPPSKTAKQGKGSRESRRKSFDPNEVICREAILLETRLSYNTPKFDYSLLKDDPKIKHFENKIVKRLVGGK